MQKVSRLHQLRWQHVVLLLICFLVLFDDQLSKEWIRAHLSRGQSLFDVGFLRITNVQNTGAAFGLFPNQSLALTIIALVGVTAILVVVFLPHHRLPYIDNMLSAAALGLVLGGTLGNLIDRFRFGYVTDFIDFRIWPAFNIADSAVTIGVIIFAYSVLRFTQVSQH